VYNILSDAEIVADVPEPGTFSLMGWRDSVRQSGWRVRSGLPAASCLTSHSPTQLLKLC